jgi:methionyl-tRNA formyltransferase
VRTVYLGTSEFAVVVLRRLAASPHRPVLVVTRPDRPRGRGRALAAPPVADAARELGIELLQPDRLDDEAAVRISAADAGAICVCAYGAIIREPLLSAPRLLNVHPSLLPRWRGAAPIERAIMAGDSETGVCIMRPTAELDAGPVVSCAREPIGGDDTYGSLAPRLAETGARLLIAALETDQQAREQDAAAATYAEKIAPRDRWLDPARPAVELERRVRALHPHVGARVQASEREVLGVCAARVLGDGPRPGELAAGDGRLVLGCAEGALELLAVQPAGRKAMDAAAYLRGRRG